MAGDPIQAAPGFYDILDKIVRWVSPLVAAIAGLIIFVYRSKVRDLEEKINLEKAEREKDIADLKKLIETQSNAMREMETTILNTFKEGLREEREFRTGVSIKQAEHIEKIFEKLEDLATQFSRLDQKMLSHIDSQEKICKLHILGSKE